MFLFAVNVRGAMGVGRQHNTLLTTNIKEKRMKKLFSSWPVVLFIVFLAISFIAAPQALSRSPDKMPYGPSSIFNIEPASIFQSIENKLFIYTGTEHRQEIIPLVENQEPKLISSGQGLAKTIIRPILLL